MEEEGKKGRREKRREGGNERERERFEDDIFIFVCR